MKITPPEADASPRARQFTQDVSAELSDVPAQQVAALLDGLVDHLLEPGEHSEHLIDEVPSPQLYAAELRASLPDLAPPPVATTRRTRFGAGRWAAVGVVAVIAVVALIAVVAVVLGLPALDTHVSPPPDSSETAPAPPQTTAGTDPDAFFLPDVVGLEEDLAVEQLSDLGLSVEVLEPPTVTGTVPSGVVIEMQPAAPSLVTTDTEVLLIVSP